jgi:hypothetical protein
LPSPHPADPHRHSKQDLLDDLLCELDLATASTPLDGWCQFVSAQVYCPGKDKYEVREYVSHLGFFFLVIRMMINQMLVNEDFFLRMLERAGEYTFEERIEQLNCVLILVFLRHLPLGNDATLATSSYGDVDTMIALALALQQPIVVYSFNDRKELTTYVIPCDEEMLYELYLGVGSV